MTSTADTSGWQARVVLTLLAIDGALSAIAGALFLPVYLGPVPFPLAGVVSGLLNAALVWAASYWTDSKKIAALPLWTWLTAVAVMTFGGPDGDLIFAGPGIMGYSALIFLALGAYPPARVLGRLF